MERILQRNTLGLIEGDTGSLDPKPIPRGY